MDTHSEVHEFPLVNGAMSPRSAVHLEPIRVRRRPFAVLKIQSAITVLLTAFAIAMPRLDP